MNWLIRDIKHALAQLQRGETWFALFLISLFCLIGYAFVTFALRTDSVLRDLHYSAAACRELSNGPIIFLFCCMIFFMFAAVITLGEFQRYLLSRRQGAHHATRQALRHGITWGIIALIIGGAALLFFNTYCR